MIDFKNDLRMYAIRILKHYGVKYKDKDDLRTLLIKLYTFWEKYITPQPRTIMESKELMQSLAGFPSSVQIAVEKMKEWISVGTDINAFQSRGLRGFGSRDYQNAVYGTVHLHLSARQEDKLPVVKKNGFAKPGRYILNAYFTSTHAYLINIIEHPSGDKNDAQIWLSKRILEIIVNNWPELSDKYRIKNAALCDAQGNKIALSDRKRAELTTNHINTFIEYEGNLYAPSFGIMGSGDSAAAALKADRLINLATSAQRRYEDRQSNFECVFRRFLERHNREIPTKFDVHFECIDSLRRFVVLDRFSGVAWDCTEGRIFLCLKQL